MLAWFAEVSASFFFLCEEGIELAEEFSTSVLAKDLIEPAWVWLLVFGGNNLDNIALFELSAEANHLAVYDGASTGGTDVAMKTIGKI